MTLFVQTVIEKEHGEVAQWIERRSPKSGHVWVRVPLSLPSFLGCSSMDRVAVYEAADLSSILSTPAKFMNVLVIEVSTRRKTDNMHV